MFNEEPDSINSLPRLCVSRHNPHLLATNDQQESEKPFFLLGDTAWELFHRLTREEADRYFADRATKGFNMICAVALAEFDGLRVPNANGDVPLHDADPRRPNEAYFAHVDALIAQAHALAGCNGSPGQAGGAARPRPLVRPARRARV